jgi:hypothetical protein
MYKQLGLRLPVPHVCMLTLSVVLRTPYIDPFNNVYVCVVDVWCVSQDQSPHAGVGHAVNVRQCGFQLVARLEHAATAQNAAAHTVLASSLYFRLLQVRQIMVHQCHKLLRCSCHHGLLPPLS